MKHTYMFVLKIKTNNYGMKLFVKTPILNGKIHTPILKKKLILKNCFVI
jgi:hypothetical protein